MGPKVGLKHDIPIEEINYPEFAVMSLYKHEPWMRSRSVAAMVTTMKRAERGDDVITLKYNGYKMSKNVPKDIIGSFVWQFKTWQWHSSKSAWLREEKRRDLNHLIRTAAKKVKDLQEDRMKAATNVSVSAIGTLNIRLHWTGLHDAWHTWPRSTRRVDWNVPERLWMGHSSAEWRKQNWNYSAMWICSLSVAGKVRLSPRLSMEVCQHSSKTVISKHSWPEVNQSAIKESVLECLGVAFSVSRFKFVWKSGVSGKTAAQKTSNLNELEAFAQEERAKVSEACHHGQKYWAICLLRLGVE